MSQQGESSNNGDEESEIPYKATREYNPLAFQAMQSQMELLMRQMQESNEKMDARLARIESTTTHPNTLQGQTQRNRPQRTREEEWGDEVNFDPHWRRVDTRMDNNLNSIKMKIPSFKGKNDADAYIE